MIYKMFLIWLYVYLSIDAARGNMTSGSDFSANLADTEDSCESKAKATANLDLAVMLLQNVRNSYSVIPPESLPTDCEDVLRRGYNRSGVYKVLPINRIVQNPINVYCDMETDGGGWTVIQRRGNFLRAKDFFYQDWAAYKKGFGSIKKDFWLGNDNIFVLSNQRHYSVRFDLEDVDGSRAYALYDTFWIDDEDRKYRLHIRDYSGNAGDSMVFMHNESKFSTKDQRNDSDRKRNCAQLFKGGWWYSNCYWANLNGIYHRGKYEGTADGVTWNPWRGFRNSLQWTEIKIRRKNFSNSTKYISSS